MTFAEFFRAAEEEALRFLVEAHGFEAVERRVERVSADCGVLALVVYRDTEAPPDRARTVTLRIAPLQRELALEIAGRGCRPYTVEELHALEGRGAFPRRVHGLYDAMHRPDELLAEFERLAGVLRASGARFFADDPWLWEDLQARRDRRAGDDAVRRTLEVSRDAFHARDWPRVIDLLAPIEHRLGERASARLAHARRRIRGGA